MNVTANTWLSLARNKNVRTAVIPTNSNKSEPKGRNDETGDLILDKEYQGNKQVHDIELIDKNRKQVIQDIINNANGTFIDQVKFYYQVPDSTKGIE